MSWAESIECPRCRAQPRQACTSPAGNALSQWHRARIVSSVVGPAQARAVAVVDKLLEAAEADGCNRSTFTSTKGQ